MSEAWDGGCLCGDIRFRAHGAPKWTIWCHCQSCRRHSGGPVSVFVGFDLHAYTVTKGEITKFKSSPRTTRGFCRTCGSTLTCESAQLPGETHFHVGTFDDPTGFEPSKHYFREEQLPWLHLK